jgi:Phage head-tail joining protein
MRPFKYDPPRISSGELRTPVIFYELTPYDGPEPGVKAETVLFTTWAKVDHVWLRDLEQAKANKTLSDVTIAIRHPAGEYFPTNRHHFRIEAPGYADLKYNVEHVQNDFPNTSFMTIVGRLEKWE